MLSKKLFLSAVCFIFGICAFAGGSIFHDSFSYRGKCIVTEEVINVRSGPGTNYEKLFQVKAGDIVEVISKCDEKMYADDAYANWYKIKKDKSVSLIPESKSTFYMPPQFEEAEGVSLGKGCILNLRRYAKYGAGSCVYSDICSVTPDLSIEKIVAADTFWEGGDYNYVEFKFEKMTYDVYKGEWQSVVIMKKVRL